jgi:hypothetical protein
LQVESGFPSTICWRGCLSLAHILGTFVENQMAVVALLSGSSVLFHWTSYLFLCQDYAVFLFFMTMLWLCSIVWSQVLWYLQCCSFVLGLLWLFEDCCAFIWTLR